MNIRKWFTKLESGPVYGSELNPCVRGDRSHHPVKYQCDGCSRWWVEPEYDLICRDRGDKFSSITNWLYHPMCHECARVAVDTEWAKRLAETDAEWERLS